MQVAKIEIIETEDGWIGFIHQKDSPIKIIESYWRSGKLKDCLEEILKEIEKDEN